MKSYLLTLKGPQQENGKRAISAVAIPADRIDEALTVYAEAVQRNVRKLEQELGA